jgi:hypothetical protein
MNLMQRLLLERNQSQQDSNRLLSKQTDVKSMLLAIFDSLEQLHSKIDNLPTQRLIVSDQKTLVDSQSNYDQVDNSTPSFIPTIDTDNMTIKGTEISSITKKRNLKDNIKGLKDISGE